MSSGSRSKGNANTPTASPRHSLRIRTPPSRDHREGYGDPRHAGVGGVGPARATGSNSSPVCLDDSFGSLGGSSELEFVGTRGGEAALVGGLSGVEEAHEKDDDEQGGDNAGGGAAAGEAWGRV